MKRIAALAASAALLIPGAAVASASTSTSCAYTHTCQLSKVDHASASRSPKSTTKSNSPAASTKTPVVVKNATEAKTASTGSLPFTGLDLGALGAGAIMLLGAGMVLRRASIDRR
jgi:hypothetical protein